MQFHTISESALHSDAMLCILICRGCSLALLVYLYGTLYCIVLQKCYCAVQYFGSPFSALHCASSAIWGGLSSYGSGLLPLITSLTKGPLRPMMETRVRIVMICEDIDEVEILMAAR